MDNKPALTPSQRLKRTFQEYERTILEQQPAEVLEPVQSSKQVGHGAVGCLMHAVGQTLDGVPRRCMRSFTPWLCMCLQLLLHASACQHTANPLMHNLCVQQVKLSTSKILGVANPRKPRVGPEFQAEVPEWAGPKQ
jgi:hypothetical protein